MEAIARNGDVDIFKITSLPKNLKKIEGKTIAYGEATGHNHTLYANDIKTEINQWL